MSAVRSPIGRSPPFRFRDQLNEVRRDLGGPEAKLLKRIQEVCDVLARGLREEGERPRMKVIRPSSRAKLKTPACH